MIKSELLLHPLGDGQWSVKFPFLVETQTAGLLTVPDGFVCDLNSIPRFLWWASTPADFPEAGVVHDWAYRGNLPRKLGDQVYVEILKHLGMNAVRRQMRYRALRAFGRFSYKGDSYEK